MVASLYPIEFVGSVQAQHVSERLPLENVRVDVDFISGERECRFAAIGEMERRPKLLWPAGHTEIRAATSSRVSVW